MSLRVDHAFKWQVNSPGRVNLLGEHIDYNLGVVLPAAIDRYVTVNARQISQPLAQINALDLNSYVEFDLQSLNDKNDVHGKRLPPWALYPAAVAWSLANNQLAVRGIEAEFSSNIPIGAGLSSSAAVEVAFALLWQSLSEWSLDCLELAQVCQQAENEYVGVRCGLMDQFAVACGVHHHALRFDTRSLEYSSVPLPPNTSIIIADSGIRRSLSSSGYNERRDSCQQAVKYIQSVQKETTSLRDVSVDTLEYFRGKLPDEIYMRAKHVVDEMARVEAGIRLLKQGDPQGFGQLMTLSHQSLRNYYQVSIPQLDYLVEEALQLQGCYGARLTGAGFGGCTVNLVAADQAENFISQLKRNYQRKYNLKVAIYACRASQGAVCHPL